MDINTGDDHPILPWKPDMAFELPYHEPFDSQHHFGTVFDQICCDDENCSNGPGKSKCTSVCSTACTGKDCEVDKPCDNPGCETVACLDGTLACLQQQCGASAEDHVMCTSSHTPSSPNFSDWEQHWTEADLQLPLEPGIQTVVEPWPTPAALARILMDVKNPEVARDMRDADLRQKTALTAKMDHTLNTCPSMNSCGNMSDPAMEADQNMGPVYCHWDGCLREAQNVEELGRHFHDMHNPNHDGFRHHNELYMGVEHPQSLQQLAAKGACNMHQLDHGFGQHVDEYICCWAGCDARFFDVFTLERHLQEDHLQAPVECMWSIAEGHHCGIIADNPNELNTHVQNNHFHAVTTCPPTEAYVSLLDQPLALRQAKTGLPTPPQEDTLTTTTTNRSEGISPKSSPLAPHCIWSDDPNFKIVCGMRCPDTATLQRHVEAAHLKSLRKPAECVCRWKDCTRGHTKPFSQRAKLERHIKGHTNYREFRCDFQDCGKGFPTQPALDQHYRTHTGEKPYECEYCGAVFAQSTSLTCHHRTHTGEKPLKCNWPGCEKAFGESSNLSKHRRTHEPGRYPCDFPGCKKNFHRPDGLKRHSRTHLSDSDGLPKQKPQKKVQKRGQKKSRK